MVKMFRNIVVVALALFSFTGCFKTVTTATTLHIKPLVEKESGGERKAAEGSYAYLYYETTGKDTIVSYEDAAAKRVTNLVTGEKRSTPDVESEVLVSDGSTTQYLSLYQEKSSALVVVVYPERKTYAILYRKSAAENL